MLKISTLQSFSATVYADVLARNIRSLIACQKADKIGIFTVGAGSAEEAKITRHMVIDIVILRGADASG